MLKSIVAIAALASAPSFTAAQAPILPVYPLTQYLPLPGYNSTAEGFNSLGNLYTSSAQQLAAQVASIAQKNVQLTGSGGVGYSYDVQASLAASLAIVNNLFWQTAYQAEQKVCSISTSINQQNVDTVKGNLRTGIAAETQAIVSIVITLSNTITAVKSQLSAFTESERAVISTLIQAIALAAAASLGPIAKLNAGLNGIGVTALNEVVQSLQSAVVSLQAAANIDWLAS